MSAPDGNSGAAPAPTDPNAPTFGGEPIFVEAPDGPTPEQAAADLHALDALMESQVPKSPEAYSTPDGLSGVAPVDMQVWKGIAHSERFAPSEFAQFATALSIAARDAERGYGPSDVGYQDKTLSQLKRAWGDDYDKQLGYARAEAKMLMQKYPQVRELFTNTLAGNSEFVTRILAQRGERRANRSK